MRFRPARKEEIGELFAEGYKAWPKGRTFARYCADNAKDDVLGTRYVLEEAGEIVSSLILLHLGELLGRKLYGIGSVLTPPAHRGKGYATKLLKKSLALVPGEDAIVLLFSEIAPAFYKRLGFRALPPHLQKEKGSVCMARCGEAAWIQLQNSTAGVLPKYF